MNRTTITLIVLGLGLVFATGARADTIETLERERAQVIEALLSPDLEPAARQAELGRALPRLVDLERLVLRDDSLRGRNTRDVARAFADYDLTFLAHASAEHRRSVIDTWLSRIGLTTEAVMAAEMGRR